MTAEVKPWPVRSEYVTDTPYGEGMTMAQIADYSEALAAAWESRCLVAVEALQRISDLDDDHYAAAIRPAEKALSRIGDLPPVA